jgi:pilus assembly protein FimV
MAPSIDEFQDLTQFADESFDTEEVDLFEFTDDDDSPLLRLKSIVLSLDWDITEEILKELNEELANLRAMWKDDKVAQIYLQGMENVGKYMREEGAYAHPNAIKLLLTLYHNYEKIISSPNISGESITTMLKADIRKFKVLQYQISTLKNAQGGHEEPTAEETAAAPPTSAKKQGKGAAAPPTPPPPAAKKKESAMPPPMRSMEATILGLEWEVTDEGLEKFNTEATELRKHLSGNNEAQVLIQGLQALGAYIREQKTESHPDAFTILHSFYDSLKMLLESPELGTEQRRQILIEQISSLNSLKEVIARSAASKDDADEEEPETEEESEDELTAGGISPDSGLDEEEDASPAGDDEGMDFAFSFDDEEQGEQPSTPQSVPQPIAAPQPAVKPKAVSPVKPAETSVADEEEEFDDDLFAGGAGGGVTPALADEEEEGGFSDSFASAGISEERTAELDEKLDSFFNFGDEEETGPKKAAVSSPHPKDELADDEPKKTEKLSLATILDDGPEGEDKEDDSEIDSSFFNFDDEEEFAASSVGNDDDILNVDKELLGGSAQNESEHSAVAPAWGEDENEQSLSAISTEDEENEDDELDAFFNFNDELDVGAPESKPLSLVSSADKKAAKEKAAEEVPMAALSDADDESEFSAAEVDEEDDGLSSGMNDFFSFDDEQAEAQPAAVPLADDDDADSFSLDSGLLGGQKEEEMPVAALADADDESEFSAAEVDEEDDGLSSGMNDFFSFDDEQAEAQPAAVPLADDDDADSFSLDSGLLGGQKEEEMPVAALADADDESEFSAAEVDEEDDGLSSGLNDFFSFDDEQAEAQPAAVPLADDDDADSFSLDSGLLGGQKEEEMPVAALSDADDESESSAKVSIDMERAVEIKDKLDSLFNFDEGETADSADASEDMPELDDDMITALDDEDGASSGKEQENFFSFHADDDAEKSSAEADSDELFGGDAVAAEEVEESGTGADEQDEAFFADDDGLTDAQEETEPVASAEVTDEVTGGIDSFLSATNEDFFSFHADDGAEAEKSLAETDSDEQDELFGADDQEENAASAVLTAEDELFSEESKADEQDDTFFAADSEADGQKETRHSDLSAFFSDEQDSGRAEESLLTLEKEEPEIPTADDDADDDLLLGQEYETESEPAALFAHDELPDPFAANNIDIEDSVEVEEPPAAAHHPAALSEIFSSLAAVAAALPAVPSGHHLRQVSELAAAAIKEPSVPPYQSIILNLLDSSASLLAKTPHSGAVSGAIVQELAAGMDKAEDPLALAGMISRYTAWQQEFFTQISHSGQQAEQGWTEAAGLQTVQEEFSQLRKEMQDEFRLLRQELAELRA